MLVWTFILSIETVYLFHALFFVKCAYSQVGGNAMDLQRMNENLMSKSSQCPVEVCQSICMRKNVTTGCFVCDPSCGTGSGTGIMESLTMNMQGGSMIDGMFNPGNYYLGYTGCKPPCQQSYSSLGNPLCACPDQQVSVYPGQGQGQGIEQGQGQSSVPPATGSSKMFLRPSASPFTHGLLPTSNKQETTMKTTNRLNPTSVTRNPTTDIKTSTTTEFRQSSVQEPSASSTTTESPSPPPSTSSRLPTSTGIHQKLFETYDNSSLTPENKINIIIMFVLTTALIVSLTVCIVFFVAWRKTARELRKNRDELYFVNKTIRQDSLASKSSILPDPVYAHITQRPEVPPRTPPMTPISSDGCSRQFLLRTLSLSSETPLKQTEADTESKHDYLDLI